MGPLAEQLKVAENQVVDRLGNRAAWLGNNRAQRSGRAQQPVLLVQKRGELAWQVGTMGQERVTFGGLPCLDGVLRREAEAVARDPEFPAQPFAPTK